MLRRRKPDPEKALVQIARARRAARDAARTRKDVDLSDGEIMAEVNAHRGMLRSNNFIQRVQAALGGEDVHVPDHEDGLADHHDDR